MRYKFDKEVIAVFSFNGIIDNSPASKIYSGLVRITDSLGISFKAYFPLSVEEGAMMITDLAKSNVKGKKRLIIATEPEFESYVIEAADNNMITDSDSTKVLLFDTYTSHSKLYTAHIPTYGVMYKAGYLTTKMRDVTNIGVYVANEEYTYINEARKGYIDAFDNSDKFIRVINMSEGLDNGAFAMNHRDKAYDYLAPDCAFLYQLIVPVCGSTIMGFIRYNRDYPGSFYTVGMLDDMSIYTNSVPFSCVRHLDKVISYCVEEWNNEMLQHFNKFPLEENWSEIVVSKDYKELLQQHSDEIHNEAILKENEYAN